MKKITYSLFILFLLISCNKSQKEPVQSEPVLTQQEKEDALRIIMDYLQCEECENGELEKVVKLGTVAVPILISTMRNGPAPAKLMEHEEHLKSAYNEMVEYEKTHPDSKVTVSQEEYLKIYESNFKALFQIRSIEALVLIGGDQAAQEIRKFQSEEMDREDVRVALDSAVKKLK